jgi:hypothetical protein
MLWEERMLRAFKSTVPRKMSGFRRGEITGKLGKLCKEKFCDLYSSPNIISVIKSRMR